MKIEGRLTIAEIYYSDKSDISYLTCVPASGGIARFIVRGSIQGITPGQLVEYSGEVKFVDMRGSTRIELLPEYIRIKS